LSVFLFLTVLLGGSPAAAQPADAAVTYEAIRNLVDPATAEGRVVFATVDARERLGLHPTAVLSDAELDLGDC